MHSDILVLKSFFNIEEAKNYYLDKKHLEDDFTLYSTDYGVEDDCDYIDYRECQYDNYDEVLEELTNKNSYFLKCGIKHIKDGIFEFDLSEIEKNLNNKITNLKQMISKLLGNLNIGNLIDTCSLINLEVENFGGLKIYDLNSKYAYTKDSEEYFADILNISKKENTKIYFVPVTILDYHF